jgi:lysophospholipase L1-like esterase
MAFGDSITKGEINDDTGSACDPGPAVLVPPSQHAIQEDLAYPAVVLNLLKVRYTDQTFDMKNEGLPLQTATGDVQRFAAVVQSDHPQAVLLLQGILDLGTTTDPIPAMIGGLDSDIVNARANGVSAIFLSTLLPLAPGFRACGFSNDLVRQANDQIRQLADREHVSLVDSYAALAPRITELMGSDGLHPNIQGQEVIGETFFGVIKQTLDPPSAAIRSRSTRRP